ncbi:MAG: hypothetical protein K2N72_07080 [Oscillospiraceae bacterium]|nr:hypothetical protein [Oscillospiraceae bacterium]
MKKSAVNGGTVYLLEWRERFVKSFAPALYLPDNILWEIMGITDEFPEYYDKYLPTISSYEGG